MLHKFIALNRDEIILRCRAKVATRSVPSPTLAEIDHGVPLFVDQLLSALRLGPTSSAESGQSAVPYDHDVLRDFTVSQVVHDYGDVCQAVTDLAGEMNAPISADDLLALNRCLDDAVAGAVTQFGRQRNQSAPGKDVDRSSEQLGFLAHELRNLVNTAIIAFEVLKTGNVGVLGSTGKVLHRSLIGARDLVGRSLAEVRLANGIQNLGSILVSGFIEELASAAELEANALGLTLVVTPVEDGITIDADRQVLAAVIANLLQNAFKFTRPRTTVTLRVSASRERVVIEVQDECGGLPDGDTHDLFRAFQQRGADRTGLGLGLAFCRWGVEASDGLLAVRDLPGQGCIFSVDLPRLLVSAPASP